MSDGGPNGGRAQAFRCRDPRAGHRSQCPRSLAHPVFFARLGTGGGSASALPTGRGRYSNTGRRARSTVPGADRGQGG